MPFLFWITDSIFFFFADNCYATSRSLCNYCPGSKKCEKLLHLFSNDIWNFLLYNWTSRLHNWLLTYSKQIELVFPTWKQCLILLKIFQDLNQIKENFSCKLKHLVFRSNLLTDLVISLIFKTTGTKNPKSSSHT